MKQPPVNFNQEFHQKPVECHLKDCEYDSLALSSKMGSGEVRKHGLFCGSRLPPVITSEGNSLRLEFLSDNSVQKSGFAAVFFTGEEFQELNKKGFVPIILISVSRVAIQ